MTVLDTNVVGIVLPTIARDLGVSFADIECVISTYMRDAGTRKEEPREFREQQYQRRSRARDPCRPRYDRYRPCRCTTSSGRQNPIHS